MWGTLGGSSGTRLVVSAHFIRLWKIVTMYYCTCMLFHHLLRLASTAWNLYSHVDCSCVPCRHRLLAMYPIAWSGLLVTCPMVWSGLLITCPMAWSGLLVTCPMVWPGLLVTCPIVWSSLLVMCPMVWSGTVSLVSTWDDGEIIYIHMKFTLNSNIPILTIWRVKWVQIWLHPPNFWHPGQKKSICYITCLIM